MSDYLSALNAADAEIARAVEAPLAALERVEGWLANYHSPEAVAQRARDLAFLRGEVSERFFSPQAQEAAQ